MSVRLHPDHGLNPTLCVCFWCGNDTGEIALLGAAYKGEAPHRMVTNYEPCPTCVENFKQGVLIIEVDPRQDTPPLTQNTSDCPTGRHWVITHEGAAKIGLAQGQPKFLITPKVAKQIGLYGDEEVSQ
jgi:hypothetical protein